MIIVFTYYFTSDKGSQFVNREFTEFLLFNNIHINMYGCR